MKAGLKDFAYSHRRDFIGLLDAVQITDFKKNKLDFSQGIQQAYKLIETQSAKGAKIFFIGNGGSAAIASHMAADFLKNAGLPAVLFNDPSLITCLSNDLGYEYVFQRPLDLLSRKGDILFSISSSGMSKNILNAARNAKKKGCFLITLTGFSESNHLRRLGDINFYLPSAKYGFVETIHHYICHCIVDRMLAGRKC